MVNRLKCTSKPFYTQKIKIKFLIINHVKVPLMVTIVFNLSSQTCRTCIGKEGRDMSCTDEVLVCMKYQWSSLWSCFNIKHLVYYNAIGAFIYSEVVLKDHSSLQLKKIPSSQNLAFGITSIQNVLTGEIAFMKQWARD